MSPPLPPSGQAGPFKAVVRIANGRPLAIGAWHAG